MNDIALPSGAGTPAAPPETAAARHRHSAWTIALHWGSALAVIAAVVTILWREAIDDRALRIVLLDVHRQAGLAVALALGARIAVRARAGLLDFSGGMPRLMHWAALGAHLALYALLLAVPVLGVLSSNAHAVAIKLFGVLPLPMLVGDDPDLADTLSDWHARVAWSLVALVVLHVAAAGWHHLARRDGVLAAMAPWIRRRD